MRRALTLLALALTPLVSAGAQRGGYRGYFSGDPNEFYAPPDFAGNVPYDGRFTFARIKYRGYAHWSGREGPGWSHDYPTAESHLMRIMKEISSLNPFIEKGPMVGSVILALDDPQLMKYPVSYLSEPGGWFPTESEVVGLRKYLQKGGFMIVDDFGRGEDDSTNFWMQMKRVLPGHRIQLLPRDHAIFNSFFTIDLAILDRECERGGGFRTPCYRGMPEYYAVFEDNDPKKRIMVMVNFNNDVGEYWQWSDQGFSVVPSNEAYKLGVNYLIYALTH